MEKKSSRKDAKTQSNTPLVFKREKVFRMQMLIVALISVLLYGNTLFNKYALDDKVIITQNHFTKMGLNGIGKIMRSDAFVGFFGENKNLLPGGRYRPLSQIVFAIEYEIFGLKPFIGHLVNVIVYALLCVMILVLLNKLFNQLSVQKTDKRKVITGYLTVPFIATLLFAAHPIHTEVVANIKSLDEILCMLGCVVSLSFVISYLNSRKEVYKVHYVFLVLSMISFLLALLSKENAMAFLAVIPLTLFVFRKNTIRDYAVTIIPFIIASGVYFIFRYKALGFVISNHVTDTNLLNNPFANSTVAEKYATIMLTWGKYLLLLLFPHPLTYNYYPKQIPIIEWTDLRAIIPFLIYAALTLFALKNIFRKTTKVLKTFVVYHNSQLISYSILFFLITFSLQSNLLINVGTFMNERFVFTSSLGFCLIAAYFIKSKVKSQKSKIIILLTILVGYSYKTISRNAVWKDDFTLFGADIKTSAKSASCNVAMGEMYLNKAKEEKDSSKRTEFLGEALNYIEHGLSLYSSNAGGLVLLGDVYLEMGDYKNANSSYQKAVDVSPGYDEAYNKLGLLYGKYLHDINKSFSYLNKAYSINSNKTSVLENLGIAYGITGNFNKSIEFFNKGISLEPDNINIYKNLEITYSKMGDKEMAKRIREILNSKFLIQNSKY